MLHLWINIQRLEAYIFKKGKSMKKYIFVIYLLFMPCISFAQCDEADDFIMGISQKVLHIIKHKNSAANELSDLFVSVVDVDWIGKFVLGSYWKTLDDTQKKQYLAKYRSFIIAAYVPLFKEYNGQDFKVDDATDLPNNQCMVSMSIYGKTEYNLSYRLKKMDDKFVVHDIIAEGVSLLSTQRSEFGAIITQKGFDALLNRLDAKNKKQISK